MTANSSLPKLFGPYILTRNLGRDPLGGTYRAGTATGQNLKPFLLIRAFEGTAIDREAVLPAMETAVEYLEEVRGQAVARGAVLGIVDDVPFAGINYVPGQTLDRMFGGPGHEAAPLPIEHALLIGEKILVALEACKAFAKATGAPHGFVIPAFVCVSNDGDTRVFGAGLGKGLLPSLKSAEARKAFAPYIAPEVAASMKPSSAGDIYSTAAIIFECLTGKAVEPGRGEDVLSGAVLSINGNPVPEDVLKLLAKGLSRDPAGRESDVVAYRKQFGKLLYGGPYAPSTFNLAFFVHQHFEKSIEDERKELALEEQIDPKPLFEAEERAAKPGKPKPAPRMPDVPTFGVGDITKTIGGTPMPKKSGLPISAVVAGIGVLGIAAFLLLKGPGRSSTPPTPSPVATAAPKPTQPPPPPPTPIIASKGDPDFDRAVQEELQKENKRREAVIEAARAADERKRQAELEARAEAARKTQELEEKARTARDRADQEEAKKLAEEARKAEEERRRKEAELVAAKAAEPKTKTGDLVDISQVDTQPVNLKIVKPEIPPIARQRRIGGTILMKVLVDENGQAKEIEILRDTTPRVGLGESSREALKRWSWKPATKDGKNVKVWIVVPIPVSL